MAIQELLTAVATAPPLSITLSMAALPILLLGLAAIYRISWLHPLAKHPGPILSRLTDLVMVYHSYIGDEARHVHALHERYGPIVRIGPNSIDFADPAAIHPIYIEKGGFPKVTQYKNFDIDGHATIFSTTDPAVRAPRAKSVLPLFSQASVISNARPFRDSRDRFVQHFNERKLQGRVNALDLCRAMSLDAVTEYLFGLRYGALSDDPSAPEPRAATGTEDSPPRMSASAVVDSFIAIGRLWFLPPWLYPWADWIDTLIHPRPELSRSDEIVNAYLDRVMAETDDKASKAEKHHVIDTYPSRLRANGASLKETHAQCKDIIFAATDTVGMNLGTICFMLAKHPDKYDILKAEVATAVVGRDEDIQQLPYLNGVVREGLRMSMTNPGRIPRQVTSRGLVFQDTFYPAGSIVSCSPYDLHFLDQIFDDPQGFAPERWLDATSEANKAMIPFGAGTRQCIAKTMAMYQLHTGLFALVKAGALEGARPTADRIEIHEGLAAKVVGGAINLVWAQ